MVAAIRDGATPGAADPFGSATADPQNRQAENSEGPYDLGEKSKMDSAQPKGDRVAARYDAAIEVLRFRIHKRRECSAQDDKLKPSVIPNSG
jgi:hypothetical protein